MGDTALRSSLSGKKFKSPTPVSLIRGRSLESGYEHQPNTPSKSKISPRRPFMVYIGMMTVLFLVGILFVRPDVGFHEGLLTRATNYDRKGNDPHRSRNIENSEARQREALEIADKLMPMPKTGKQDNLGQLRGGGGTFESQLELEETPYPFSSQNDEFIAQSEPNVDEYHQYSSNTNGSDVLLSADVHEAVKEDPSTAEAALAAAVERPATVIISQPLVNGGAKRVVVERTKVKFLEILSDGLESQDLEGIHADEKKSWWISSHNTKLPERWNIGKASPAAKMMPSHLSEDTKIHLDIMRPQDGDENCKIHVMDLNLDLGPKIGARKCNLAFKRVWPFARRNWGIDGVTTLQPQDYQYSNEYWLAKAIRESSYFEPDASKADLIFVDNYCYHVAWLAYIHPLGNRNTTDPEPYMRKTLDKLVKSQRFINSKGGDFVFTHPSPVMRGLFKEEAMCEDLASAFHLVPERSSLCVWTQDAAAQGRALIMPYVATLDLDLESDLQNNPRDLLLYFRGGCGHPNPSIRGIFAAGKMLRYDMVHGILAHRNASDIDMRCSCDICDNHTPHPLVLEGYRRSKFCPVVPSNAQSSRRLSEIILSGCIPVFIGPPYHTLPLSLDVDYASMAIFINITNSSWIDKESPHYLQNRLVSHLWPLEDSSLEKHLVPLENMHEVVDYLRNFPSSEEARKRQSVLSQRYKFYYGAVPESDGGDGRQSELANIAMKHMCRHAATEKRRLRLSISQGITKDQHLTVRRGSSLMHDSRSSGTRSIWSILLRRPF